MPGTLKAWPRTTLAVFLPTPGNVMSSSKVLGTVFLNVSTIVAAVFWMFSALLLKKFMDLMASLISESFAVAKACGVGNFLKSDGDTLFILSSVHCAERITAINNSNVFLCVKNVPVLGYFLFKKS